MSSSLSNSSKVYPTQSSSLRDRTDEYDLSEKRRRLSETINRIKEIIKQNRCKTILVIIALLTSITAIVIVLIALIAGCYTHHTITVQPFFVYMIWRHGDRTPIEAFDAFPTEMTDFADTNGTLTKIGFDQALELGKRIRRRYFEHQNFSADQVYIRSTNISRTITTAEAIIQALQIPGIGVAIESSMDRDTVGNPLFECERASQIVESWGDRYLMRANHSELYDLLARELNYTGYVHPVMDTIECWMAHNLSLPEWASNKALRNELRSLSWIGLQMQYGIGPFENEELKMMRTGGVLHSIVEEIQSRILQNSSINNNININNNNNININNTIINNNINNINNQTNINNNNNIYFYGSSAHDITLAALLMSSMNVSAVFGPLTPHIDYAANMAFELYNIKGKFKLKILYANRFDEQPKDVTRMVRGCEVDTADHLCDVGKFIEQADRIYMENVWELCSKSLGRKVKRSIQYFSGNLADVFVS